MAFILLITAGALFIATGLIVCGVYLLLKKEQEKKSKQNAVWMIIGGICLGIIFAPNALALLNSGLLF